MHQISAIFESSMQAFRNSLSEEERKVFRMFDSPAAMMQEIQLSCSNHKERNRLLFCCKKITAFSNAFTPYFGIIDIFVQIRPEWLGWFWGSIRLVFKLGSNYVTFLEKIADMFERMSFALPQYQRHLDACLKRPSNKDPARLVQVMSFLYDDIIQFCQEVCCMFSRGSKGSKLRHRIGFLGEIIWKPFDSRFSELNNRIAKHQSWFDREMTISDQQVLTQHYEDFLAFLRGKEELDEKEKAKAIAKQERLAAKQIEHIKSWISSPDYRSIFERSLQQRYSRSGEWFLNMSEYLAWRDTIFNEDSTNNLNALQRILFLQAKPGYGKTFLSSVIIQDLQLNTTCLVRQGENPPTTAFFHFNSNDKFGSRVSQESFHAITTQLIHAHRQEKITIDALALLIDKAASGQYRASEDDIDAILKILMRQYPTFLVIDGVDECGDKDNFLTKIRDLCQVTDCRILLLSRPNISFPWCFPRKEIENRIFPLSHCHNLEDIKSFLLVNLRHMASDDLFGDREIQSSMIDDVSTRANGMFLWAKLLINYLSSDALTPLERHTTLSEANLLEGLDRLYCSILNMLCQRSEKEKIVAADIFKWLSTSLYALNAKVLHTALAIIPGVPTSKLQYLSYFPASVPKITCALVEVDQQGVVRFIHLSLKEYLESAESVQNSEFSLFDKNKLHEHLAIRCLSYITQDIPRQPLGKLTSWREQASADSRIATFIEASRLEDSLKDKLDVSFPFLRYASLCWPEHLTRSLSPGGNMLKRKDSTFRPPLYLNEELRPLLSQFLLDRLIVTTWVEACWTYGLPPKLSHLVPLVKEMGQKTWPQDLEDREVLWIVLGLHQLSEALEELKGKHHVAMKGDPTIIWRNEIIAATDSSFWPVWVTDVVIEGEEQRKRLRTGAGFRSDGRLAGRASLVVRPL